MLVIGMLIIHASFLSIPPGGLQTLVYPRLLGFVSGSWVVISGFIIGAYYRSRFPSARTAVTRRLLGRGGRLVAIFAVTNVLLGKISLTCPAAGTLGDCDPVRVLLLGDLTGQTFEILVAIGYLLMLSPVFLWWPGLSAIVTGVLLILAPLASLLAGASLPGLARMLLCGAAGIAVAGFLTPGQMSSLRSERRPRRVAWTLAAVGFGAYIGLSEADATGRFQVTPYLVYVMSALVMLYLASVWIPERSRIGRQLTLMAHYSLPSYIWQMAILQALRLLMPDSPVIRSFPVVFCVALAALLISLHVFDYLRGRYALADNIYHAIFG
jgi:hypothetical protein